jgi:hypothetical protein
MAVMACVEVQGEQQTTINLSWHAVGDWRHNRRAYILQSTPVSTIIWGDIKRVDLAAFDMRAVRVQ